MIVNKNKSSKPVIEIKEMHKWFGNFHVLKNISLGVNQGERIVICGPSGSGKEIAARYIHQNSPRANNRFLTIACASIQSEKMEELLFGQEVEGKISPGLFEKAHGGTLFFDEVAELHLGTQAKILRILVYKA